METKIKTSQLTGIIKQVVRESLQQREYNALLKEVSPPGKKAERMIQHVKKSLRKSHPDWDEEKITSVAIATGWKSHNKGNVEEGEKSMHEYEPEDDTGPLPKTGKDMERSKGNFDPDYQLKWGKGKKDKKKEGEDVDEAGLTSEEGEGEGDASVSSEPDMDDETTDGQINDHIAALLQAVFYSPKTKNLSNTQKVALVKKIVDQGVDSLKEASYKKVSPNETDTSEEDKARTIQTDPEVNESIGTSMLEKVKSILKGLDHYQIPPVLPGRDQGTFWVRYPNNTLGKRGSELLKPIATEYGASGQGGLDYLYHLNNVDEASYKVVSPNQVRTSKCDHARTIQTEPKVTENHKVQARSYKTVNDLENDPKNVVDPEVPQA